MSQTEIQKQFDSSVNSQRRDYGFHTPEIQPGRDIMKVVNTYYPAYMEFELLQGTHAIQSRVEIDKPVTLSGSKGSIIRIMKGGCLVLSGYTAEINSIAFTIDSDHTGDAVILDGFGIMLIDLDFEGCHSDTVGYAFRLTAKAQHAIINECLLIPEDQANAHTLIYAEDGSLGHCITGCNLCGDAGIKNLISVKGTDNSVVGAPGGLSGASFLNYADIDVRP